jgi:hypothetical protein
MSQAAALPSSRINQLAQLWAAVAARAWGQSHVEDKKKQGL